MCLSTYPWKHLVYSDLPQNQIDIWMLNHIFKASINNRDSYMCNIYQLSDLFYQISYTGISNKGHSGHALDFNTLALVLEMVLRNYTKVIM